MKDIINIVTNGEPTTGLITAITEIGIKYYDDIRNERIYRFFKELYLGIANTEQIKYYEEILKSSKDDFYMLLSAAIEDEEKYKTPLYINLFRNILKNKLSNFEKISYLKLSKELSFNSFELLRKIYATYKNGLDFDKKHNLNENDSISYIFVMTFLNDLNKYEHFHYDLSLLKQFELIYKFDNKSNDYTISSYGIKIVNMFYNEEQLLPESNHLLIKNKEIEILSTDNELDINFTYINDILKRIPLKTIGEYNIDTLNNIKIGSSHIILLVGKNSISPQNLIYFFGKPAFYGKKIIKVALEPNINDPFPNFGTEIIYLQKGNLESELNFLSKIK